jgi:PKD repeat protein
MPGIYIVYLTITDNNGYEAYDVAYVAVGAAGAVNATIEVTPVSQSGTDPFTVGFDASDSTTSASGETIVSYTWDFDNGTSIVINGIVTPGIPPIPVQTYTFSPAGTHLVKLTVEDSDGNLGYAFKSIVVTAD